MHIDLDVKVPVTVLIITLFHQQVTGVYKTDICRDHGFVPLHGTRKPLPAPGLNFYNGSKLRYVCNESYALQPPNDVQLCVEGSWFPSLPPDCVKTAIKCSDPIHVCNGYEWTNGSMEVNDIVYSSQIRCHAGFIPDPNVSFTVCTSNGTWSNDLVCIADPSLAYCARPPPLENGLVFCCGNKGDHPLLNESNFCCWPGGTVQFECNSGFTMTTGQPSWLCNPSGAEGGIAHVPDMPVCAPDYATDPAHTGGQSLSDGMIKIMVSVTSGVLVLLLIIIAFAFCKPKLKDIKRRWRDLREDENGLIVDGRRVYLPSYEQATSHTNSLGWCDLYQQVAPSSNLDESSDVTMPPQSNTEDFTPSTAFAEIHPRNSPTRQFEAESEREDQLTVVEFLRELPSTSTGISSEISGFEDSFVPIHQVARHLIVPSSPTSSLSSTEAMTAPLLTESSSQRSKAKVKCKSMKNNISHQVTEPVVSDTQTVFTSSNAVNMKNEEILAIPVEAEDSLNVSVEIAPSVSPQLINGTGEVALDRISLNCEGNLSTVPRDRFHADSTTV